MGCAWAGAGHAKRVLQRRACCWLYGCGLHCLHKVTIHTLFCPVLQGVREAFLASEDALAAVVGMLAEPLSRHPRMNEQDTALVQLVITFLRFEKVAGGCSTVFRRCSCSGRLPGLPT